VASEGTVGADGALRADAVVVATSAREAGRLAARELEPAERDFFSGPRQRPAITLTAELLRAPSGMPEQVRLPQEEGFSAESVVFEPGLAGSRVASGTGLVTVCARADFARAAAQVPDDGVEKSLLADLETLYPALAGSIGASRLQRSAAGIPAFDVGAYRSLQRFRRVQQDRRALGRRLYFAGDYLIAPGAEGRVVSGFRAAADLIADARGSAPGFGT
jgi:protoporphyrinogen oxidase